ncbi:MAG: hypothetical protein HDT18_07890 [Oscillibacter sp.]|nr:hypothetical protein [Oscillibacter sp.]
MDNAIYIVFSTTPTGMGWLIRKATRNRYNHVSISLSRDMDTMYTFARIHRRIPLYGGFVAESNLRYQTLAGAAHVKICRLEVTQQQLACLHDQLEQMWNKRDEYIYNTLAAAASLVHLRPAIFKAHTCVTFVQALLAQYNLAEVCESDPPTVRALESRLAPWTIYKGPIPACTSDWGKDIYPSETTARYAVYTTARHFGRLALRVLAGGII